jgi:hypothetical protein
MFINGSMEQGIGGENKERRTGTNEESKSTKEKLMFSCKSV